MLFNSFQFLVFFPIVAIFYYALPHHYRWVLLLTASCYFYMVFIPAYILVLFYLILIDFCLGVAIEKAEGNTRKLLLGISILANIGTLFLFKYFNFFEGNIAHIAALLHWNYPLPSLELILPLGLSFHTFQSLAYIIEVYRKQFPAERHLGIYALYVMFFPQLVAGPIERPQHLLPQLHGIHDFQENTITRGLVLMLWGFFKKIVVADTAGVFVDNIYNNLHSATGAMLGTTAIIFAMQLYADFSGYTDIARGTAMVFGINLVKNFEIPYFARSIADFWRRWHISLSTWFRDYLYYPLAFYLIANSRTGIYTALFITFVIIGLWHGAGWTFVLFGSVLGAYSIVGLSTKRMRERLYKRVGIIRYPHLYAAAQIVVTFALITIALVFFRSPSVSDATYFIGNLSKNWGDVFGKQFWMSMIATAQQGLTKKQLLSLAIASIVMLKGEYLENRGVVSAWLNKHSPWMQLGAYYVLIFWILTLGYHAQKTFIYFQF